MNTLSGLTIIGLAGYKGTGKDTVARLIRGVRMRHVAFADPLRDAVRAMYGFSWDQLLHPNLKELDDPFWGVSPRTALRDVGMRCMRQVVRDDFWLKVMERRMMEIRRRSLLGVSGFVISDVRFPNELDFVRSLGGEVWCVYRPGHEFDGHATETLPQDPSRFDRVIENRGSLADLRKIVSVMLGLCQTKQWQKSLLTDGGWR